MSSPLMSRYSIDHDIVQCVRRIDVDQYITNGVAFDADQSDGHATKVHFLAAPIGGQEGGNRG
ncbi:MAG: hypothetical protein HY308_11415 [Gammaproteobacteria bacterium]|nr:hypothetical protein [Gammaproteobacteria bacterium]